MTRFSFLALSSVISQIVWTREYLGGDLKEWTSLPKVGHGNSPDLLSQRSTEMDLGWQFEAGSQFHSQGLNPDYDGECTKS